MLITASVLKALLEKHGCSLSKVGRAIGVSPQRVEQLMQSRGVAVRKRAVIVKRAKGLVA